jgi:all-trans-retinol dehydrogenase (NAD+)
MNLEGTCAVVTGGAMGIGFETSKRLLKEGVTVTIWDLNPSALKKAKRELSAFGKVYAYPCDVTDKKKVYKLAAVAKKDMGRVDILVNNAGYVSGGGFLERPDEHWERTVDVNLKALLYTTRAFLPDMYKRNNGHIVNVSSAAGTIGVAGLAVYTAIPGLSQPACSKEPGSVFLHDGLSRWSRTTTSLRGPSLKTL